MHWLFGVALCILILVAFNVWLRSLRVQHYKDKHVFITGCDSGFGRALAMRLDKMGFQVFAACLTEKGEDELRKICSSFVKTLSLDVTNDESIKEALHFVNNCLPSGKGLWAVVNNAGIGGNSSPIELLTKKDFEEVLKVNLLGPIEVTRTFLPLIRKELGRVVTVTSIAGRLALISGPYTVSKFGLEGYMDVLRRELYMQGIKVCILEPGRCTATNIWDERVEQSFEESYQKNASAEFKTAYGEDFYERRLQVVKSMRQEPSFGIDEVINAYVHAITAVYPKTRYVVGLDAKFIFLPLTFLPDWLCDWLIHLAASRIK